MSTQDTPVIDTKVDSSAKVDNALFTDESTPVTTPEETVTPPEAEGKKPETESGEAGAKKTETPESITTETVVEEDLELSLAENSGLTEFDAEQVKAFAKENKLTKEAAQKLLDDRASYIAKYKQQSADQLAAQQKIWLEETKADSEVGGANFETSVTFAKMALDKYADAGLRKTLDDTGLGNNRMVLRTFARIGKAMQSDTYVTAPKNAAAKVKEDWDILYPDKT